MQGVVKVFDPGTGHGLILLDDDSGEVLLGPGSLKGSVFRTLRQGQRVVFETREEDGLRHAIRVRLGSDGS